MKRNRLHLIRTEKTPSFHWLFSGVSLANGYIIWDFCHLLSTEKRQFYTVSCNFYKNNIYSLLTLLICFRGDKRTSLYTNSNKKLKDTFSLPAHFSYSQEMTNFSARVTNCERQWNSYIRNWSVIVSERIRTKERHVETMRKIPRPPPQQNSPLLSALNITANWQGPVGRPQKTKGYAFHFTLYTTLQGWYLT